MSHSSWSQWFQHTCRRLRDTARQRVPPCRPGMEPLEDRSVPAIYNVTGLGDAAVVPASLGEGTFNVATLRQAIEESNANPGVDTINLPVGQIDLTVNGNQEDANATGDLDITDSVIIQGQGAGVSIVNADFDTESNPDRVFHILSKAEETTTFRGFTIQNGLARFFTPNSQGGGIFNDSDLQLEDMLIKDNLAESDYGGGAAQGGGIYNGVVSNLTLLRTTLLGNTAHGFGNLSEADDGQGGGIFNDYGGTVDIDNSTFDDNTAIGGEGFERPGNGQGGAIYNALEGDVEITLSRLVNNSALADDNEFGAAGHGEGGGIFNLGDLTVTTTTLDNNTAHGALGGEFGSAGDASGGGIHNEDGTVTIDRSTLSNNMALGGTHPDTGPGSAGDAEGGGYSSESGDTTIINSTFSGNVALGGSNEYGGASAGTGIGGGLYFGRPEGSRNGPLEPGHSHLERCHRRHRRLWRRVRFGQWRRHLRRLGRLRPAVQYHRGPEHE